MKFVIEHAVTKRQIDGPFGICASRADFELLISCVRDWLSANDGRAVYGWVDVCEKHARVPNQSPLNWVEAGMMSADGGKDIPL